MRKILKNLPKRDKKLKFNTEIRKKLGISQLQLAGIFNHTKNYMSMVEAGKRDLRSGQNVLLLNMYTQFHELETGKQANDRSLETRLFLNDAYKNILPKMQMLEKECRLKIKELEKKMDAMKEQARNMEHAIIVFTTTINTIREGGEINAEKERQMRGLNLLKEQAYDNLLTCWEPEQAKLQGKIEAVAGEAKALRRYRIKVLKEHNPFKT
jgi:transcriptional regulator with XRE-family HTH domain